MSRKRPLCARIDISKTAGLSGLNIGEEATVTIVGTVKALNAPREDYYFAPGGSKSSMMPGSIEIEIDEIRVSGSDPDDV
jgi:hypothetical protein